MRVPTTGVRWNLRARRLPSPIRWPRRKRTYAAAASLRVLATVLRDCLMRRLSALQSDLASPSKGSSGGPMGREPEPFGGAAAEAAAWHCSTGAG